MPETHGMKSSFSSEEIAKRQEYILGTKPRLPALPKEQRTDDQQKVFDEISTVLVDGVLKPRDDLDSLEILIRHHDLYLAHIGVAKQFLSDAQLSIRDRELAILRIGWLSQAPYEWAAHVMIGKRNGMTTEEVEQVIEGSSSPNWNDHERAIIRAMEEIHFDSMISDESWATLAETYTDKQLMELIVLAGQYKTVAYLQNSLKLPLSPKSREGLMAR